MQRVAGSSQVPAHLCHLSTFVDAGSPLISLSARRPLELPLRVELPKIGWMGAGRVLAYAAPEASYFWWGPVIFMALSPILVLLIERVSMPNLGGDL